MNANNSSPASLASVLVDCLEQVDAAGRIALERTRGAADIGALQVREAVIEARRALIDRTEVLSAELELARGEARAKVKGAMQEGAAELLSDANLFKDIARQRTDALEAELAAEVAAFLAPASVVPTYEEIQAELAQETDDSRKEMVQGQPAEAPVIASAACGPVETAEGPTVQPMRSVAVPMVPGSKIRRLMRQHKADIKGLARQLGTTMQRVREVRQNGLDARTAVDWVQTITGRDPGFGPDFIKDFTDADECLRWVEAQD